MRKMILAAALALAASASSIFGQTPAAQTSAQQGSAEQALVKLTNDWLDAEARSDTPALERIVADDFAGTAPAGNTVTKRDVVPSAPGARSGGMAFTAQDVRARVFGETGVVTGRGVSRGQGPEMRFTVVFVRRLAGWQMVAGHLSVVPRGDGQ